VRHFRLAVVAVIGVTLGMALFLFVQAATGPTASPTNCREIVNIPGKPLGFIHTICPTEVP
jgi:hypothetical protein